MKKISFEKRLYFDGGTGTVLQSMGLEPGKAPENWTLEHPEKIKELHFSYYKAGADIVKTNTFGVNCTKYSNYAELISKAVGIAKKAAGEFENKYVAYDIGPLGRLLKPLGDLDFEEAVEIFAKGVKVASESGADLVLIETMNDIYETKAAVIAAKENSNLPVFVTNAYGEDGKLMTGADPVTVISVLEGLGVDAIGANCSFGPDKMLEIAEIYTKYSSLPLIFNPNAGLPRVENGKTVFDIAPDTFSQYMVKMAEEGACILGGCCGTTPEYIKAVVEKTKNIPILKPTYKTETLVSSYTHSVEIGKDPVLIGERINPTGKKKLKEALRNGDRGYILGEALNQVEKGAHILDVNVGLPEIDEKTVMKETVFALQEVTDTPLQLDSSSPDVLEASMRIYNGKPLINSVNGKKESMDSIFPLVKKYGGTLIALTLDENGIPKDADGRIKIALKIAEEAEKFGIHKKDLVFDPLCLTVSSDDTAATATLEAVKKLNSMGFRTSLGVSNVSFGLPERDRINSVFFSMALQNGLDCAIMNPYSERMTDAYKAYLVLSGKDKGCLGYIDYASQTEKTEIQQAKSDIDLEKAVRNGLKDTARSLAAKCLETEAPLDVINNRIVPALNGIGADFEKGKAFLPQLLMSAEAATSAFALIKEKIPKGQTDISKAVILATVKGDIHDIGKNIVKVLLESYGFTVYDLGRDVPAEKVLEKVKETGCKLVGLSALMTTTVPAMEQTIKLLSEYSKDIVTIVGGAVLNEEYAQMIHAGFYAKDAMETVRIATDFYASESKEEK